MKRRKEKIFLCQNLVRILKPSNMKFTRMFRLIFVTQMGRTYHIGKCHFY